MPRPKPPVPLVQFHVKIQSTELEAVDAIVDAWADERSKAAGVDVPADRSVWFRAMVKEKAAGYGITIADPAPSKPAKKTTAPAKSGKASKK